MKWLKMTLNVPWLSYLDFINFSMSIAMHIADEIGVAPEQLDTMMDRINRLRDAKYRIDLFHEHPPEDAIQIARDLWDAGRPGLEPRISD